MTLLGNYMNRLRYANEFFAGETVTLRIYATDTDRQGLGSNTTDFVLNCHVMPIESKDNRMEELAAGTIDENEGVVDVDWAEWCDKGLGDINTCQVFDFVLRHKARHQLVINGQTYKVNNINPLDKHENLYNVVRIPFEKIQKKTNSINI